MATVVNRFAALAADVTAATQFAAEAVEAWGLDPGDAELVVGELAANALIHAESPFTVSLTYEPNRLRIEVTDDGPGLPSPTEDGFGLRIVDGVSCWGVHRRVAGGKTVWAELLL
jgi:anti-sigma regulatory factor (Ser/Thr protein kinase)